MIGKRIIAWRGPNIDLHGTVIRVDGVTHCFIRWDNGTESHESNSNIMWEEFAKA